MKPLILSAAVGLFAGLAAAPVGSAQTVPPLTWELVGFAESLVAGRENDGIAFREGSALDGSFDTLHVANGDGVFRMVPGAPDWEHTCNRARCSAFYIEATKESYLLIGMEAGPSSGGARSIDGGFTWEDDAVGHGIAELFQSTLPALGGAVYACGSYSCSRSFEGGSAGTWLGGGPMGGQPDALAEVAPSDAFPEGRLLGGAWNGIALSGDGGQTWMPSGLWEPGRFVVASLAFLPLPAHPYGGAAFAGVRDFGLGEAAVYRSDDGGRTWARVLAVGPGDYGVALPGWMAVAAVPGASAAGLVVAGPEDVVAGPEPSVGPVLASADGGQTWEVVADSANGWGGFAVNVFEVGRDGRLYAGTDRGVWRTAEAVFPVSAEGAPEPGKPGVELEMYPNPMGRAGTVAFTLAEASEVRVMVYDVLGRRLALLAEGRFEAGLHRLALDGAGLPAGLYLVRATGDGFEATQRVTVLR